MGRPRKREQGTGNRLQKPAINPLTGTESEALPVSFSAEAIAERQEKHDDQASVYVIHDNWDRSLLAGINQFEEVAQPFLKANPDKHFRWLSRNNRRGRRGHELVEHPKTQKTVSVAQYDLGWLPNEVHDENQREVEKRATAALGGSSDTKQMAKDAFREAEGIAIPMPGNEALDF